MAESLKKVVRVMQSECAACLMSFGSFEMASFKPALKDDTLPPNPNNQRLFYALAEPMKPVGLPPDSWAAQIEFVLVYSGGLKKESMKPVEDLFSNGDSEQIEPFSDFVTIIRSSKFKLRPYLPKTKLKQDDSFIGSMLRMVKTI